MGEPLFLIVGACAVVFEILWISERKKRREAERIAELRQKNIDTMRKCIGRYAELNSVNESLCGEQAAVIAKQDEIIKALLERERAREARITELEGAIIDANELAKICMDSLGFDESTKIEIIGKNVEVVDVSQSNEGADGASDHEGCADIKEL